ncbi:MAG: 50S ribosomal protein L9 [Myxococcota bacterium]
MRVILQKDVPHLGSVGEIVKVKDGFARNYLVPRGLAVIADERNVRRLSHQKRQAEARAARELAVAKAFAARLEENAVTIRRQAGEDGKLFGAVTNRDIAEAFAADGFEIDRRTIDLEEPIKTLGLFNLPVKLDRGVQATIKVYVVIDNS